MKKKRKREYLRMLELGGDASRDDIENAYSHFVKLYSSEESPEIHPLKEEISMEERKKILSDIDEAYKALVGEDGVNRVDFSAEIEPQEIILDEDNPMVIEHEEIESSEETQSVSEPVVEFRFSEEQIEEAPVHESTDDIVKKGDPIVEIGGNEKEYNEVPDEIVPQIIEFEEELTDEGSVDNVADEPEIIEPQTIEFEEDSPDELEGSEGSFEEEPVKIDIEDAIVDKAPIEEDVEITGKYLKKIRESRKLKVRDVGEILNVEYKILAHIENEKFEKLNDAGYLRWIIKTYSKFLGLNEENSAEDYMKRYRLKK